ncbi:phosphotransferase [Cellulosilyticum ruminicola]|uniref:phosphotransferase n=1 Tax=Cellulosilyticum ruminicola TaxID=425254 RepID=UPI0006D1A78B|nr:phosphotransferase [Cellulosilyticum ruminicola]
MEMENVQYLINRYYGYDLENIRVIKALEGGWDNSNYLVEIDNKQYVFRKYLLTPKTSVKQEIELIKLLNKLDFPTFRIVRDQKNEVIVGENEDSYILYEYIECSGIVQVGDMEKIVELANKLHVITYNFNINATRNRYEDIENKFIHFVKENNHENIPYMNVLLDFINKWVGNEKQIILAKYDLLRKSWVHHDLNPENLLVSADGKISMIDFDECMYASFLVDIISIFHYWCLAEDGTSFDSALAEKVIQKYNVLTPLTAVEKELLPYLIVQYQLEDTLFFIKRELEEDPNSIKDVMQSYSFNGLQLLYGMLKEGKLKFNL